MRRLAEYATRNRGRVLEIGFGLGISASEIMSLGCDEYVVIEAHPEVAERARQWGRAQATPVSVVEDFWQNSLDRVGRFDGILFDTYPVNNSPSKPRLSLFIDRGKVPTLKLALPTGPGWRWFLWM